MSAAVSAFDVMMKKKKKHQQEQDVLEPASVTMTINESGTKRKRVADNAALGKSRFTTCPACGAEVPTHRINSHLDEKCAETTARRNGGVVTPPRVGHEGLPGLVYIDEFLTRDEETRLLDIITTHPSLKLSNVNGRRHGMHFGVGWPLGSPTTPLPVWLRDVVTRVEAACVSSGAATTFRVNQIAINVYRRSAGDSMRAHIDDRKHSGPAIACLSLGAECEMRFTPEAEPDRAIDVSLPPRSLQIMAGDSRFKWRHAVLNDGLQGELRVSIILRACGGHPAPTFQE
jgi:alkylated DNA repair dioxygenase AlkB